jgi:hypothetical protein
MRNYLLLFLSIFTISLSAQNTVFTDKEKEDIYDYFLFERPYSLPPLHHFIITKFLQLDGEETLNASNFFHDNLLKFTHTDSGFVFSNISEKNATASYGLMKDVYIYFDYTHPEKDLEEHIHFDWHFHNTYNNISGIAKVKIRSVYPEDESSIFADIWIEVPADPKRKNESEKDGYTIFIRAEFAEDIDKKNNPLFRL